MLRDTLKKILKGSESTNITAAQFVDWLRSTDEGNLFVEHAQFLTRQLDDVLLKKLSLDEVIVIRWLRFSQLQQNSGDEEEAFPREIEHIKNR